MDEMTENKNISAGAPLLEVKDLTRYFDAGYKMQVHAVDHIS